MCGITGFCGGGTKSVLEKMTAALRHRGPDGTGFFFDEAKKIGLGHARLAIIDLNTGDQPIFNEDKTVAVIFNGEIYNFKDLRKKLEQKHVFTTNTDTEVIAHLYEDYGTECFKHLNGMFAIALYDAKSGALVLARDRMGKKPLYWGIFGNSLLFGSEPKSLFLHPAFKKELDLYSLNKYLSYEYVPTPHSIYKGVYKLEPASYLIWRDGKADIKSFWQISSGGCKLNFKESLNQLDKLLSDSVEMRMVSDVPLGVFLSGGIDSSTVAYYAQKNSSRKIKTFSIGFKEKSFDESDYARAVSKHLGTDHFEAEFASQDLINLVPKIFDFLDEPLADISILPTFLLSRFARGKATVALGGDGGDELFCGYDTFMADYAADIYSKIPVAARKYFIEPLINSLPVQTNNFSLDFKLKQFVKGVGEPGPRRHLLWLGSFNYKERGRLFKPEIWFALQNQDVFENAGQYANLNHLYLRTYMMDGVLVKVDRASMANSLEVRSPFLDWMVADFANSLPYDFKLRRFTSKYILKKLMADKLPPAVIKRPKKGFGVPLALWLKNELRAFCDEVLSERNINKSGIFNFEFVNKLKQEHFAGKRDNRKQLWTLMVFQMWQNKWGL